MFDLAYGAIYQNCILLFTLGSCNKDLKLKMSNECDVKSPDDQLEKINYAELASDNHKIAKVNGDRYHKKTKIILYKAQIIVLILKSYFEIFRDYLTEVMIKVYLDLNKNKNFASLLADLSDIAAKAYHSLALDLQHNENRRFNLIIILFTCCLDICLCIDITLV